MKSDLAIVILIAMLPGLGGCASQPAPEFGGRWRAANRFAETPQEIQLHRTYVFFASPLDETLKKMLQRWAADSQMTLSYEADVDYTLHAPVSAIRSGDVKQAAQQLTRIYAKQGIAISVEENRIVVRGKAPAMAVRVEGGDA